MGVPGRSWKGGAIPASLGRALTAGGTDGIEERARPCPSPRGEPRPNSSGRGVEEKSGGGIAMEAARDGAAARGGAETFGPADDGGLSDPRGADIIGPGMGGVEEDGAETFGPGSETGGATGGAAGGAMARCHLSATSLGSLGGDGGRQAGRNP